MTRRVPIAAIVVVLAACWALAAAELPQAWKNWRYFRPIELPLTDTSRIAGLVIPQEVYAHAQARLCDVRLIDDAGVEVPYAQFTRDESVKVESFPTILRENSFAPGEYTQVVLDVGEKSPFHNSVRIDTATSDFIEWVHVEASDDARHWRIVQERSPVFRFQKEGRDGTQVVHYSENNARYLRVRILDGERRFQVSGAKVFYRAAAPAEEAPIATDVRPDPATGGKVTAWWMDVGAPAVNIRAVRFAVGPAEFSRNVEVSKSDDGREWVVFATGQIYRFRQRETIDEQLSVPVPNDSNKRYWRVVILNGNDAPLPEATPILVARPQHVVFEQQPGRSYRLLYGQSRVHAPEYDLERRLDAKQKEAAVAGQAGAEEENSKYLDPQPWTERNGYLLWIVVGIVALVLGYSAILSLRKSVPVPPTSA